MRDIIKNIINQEVERQGLKTRLGIVKGIDDSERTCDVEFLDGSVNKTCRIDSILDNDTGIYLKPSISSYVVVSFHKPTEGFILKASEYDKAYIKIGDLEFLLDDDNKIKINNGTNDLLTEIESLIDQIKLITVPTPSGTSGTPINATAFDGILTNIKKLIK